MDPVGIDVPRPRPDTADVCAARQTLEEARTRLDSAVAGLTAVDGDEAMATPELLVLLVGAVAAKERLDALQAVVALSSLDGDGK
jgi:hypothetical protein